MLVFRLSVLIVLSLASNADGADELALEVKIKAAYLAKFARFAQWPKPDNSQQLIIAINSTLPGIQELNDLIAGKTQDGRDIIFKHYPVLDQIPSAHIIYIDSSNDFNPAIANYWQQKNTILVGDREDFLTLGGGIQLIKLDNRLGFIINEVNLEKANIDIHFRMRQMSNQFKSRWQSSK